MILINSIVIKRMNFDLEKFALATLLSYMITTTIRLVENLLYFSKMVDPYNYDVSDNIVKLSVVINWVIIYVAIFEIQLLSDKIRSDSISDYQIRHKKSMREKKFVLSFLIITFSITFLCFMQFITESQYFYDSVRCPLSLSLLIIDFVSQCL